ncbi:hypothetical protein J22TS1_17080 [Siminovitchia terrae]|nr:hypothetical protein J22TS1_17080 [Siminovitchia terrae]
MFELLKSNNFITILQNYYRNVICSLVNKFIGYYKNWVCFFRVMAIQMQLSMMGRVLYCIGVMMGVYKSLNVISFTYVMEKEREVKQIFLIIYWNKDLKLYKSVLLTEVLLQLLGIVFTFNKLPISNQPTYISIRIHTDLL